MNKRRSPETDIPKGAIVLSEEAPVGSVAALAEREGGKRAPRTRGPGVQIYIEEYMKEVLVEYSDASGVSQKHFATGALRDAFMKIGIDTELRRPTVTAESLAARPSRSRARGRARE